MRSPHGTYAEYHTSGDDLSFIDADALSDTVCRCADVFALLEGDAVYTNLQPKGEPQLGRRGLHRGVAGRRELPDYEHALLWVLNFSDDAHSLLDIAERAQLSFNVIHRAAEDLRSAGLLALAGESA